MIYILVIVHVKHVLIVVHCTPDFEIIIWNQLQGFKSLKNVLSKHCGNRLLKQIRTLKKKFQSA